MSLTTPIQSISGNITSLVGVTNQFAQILGTPPFSAVSGTATDLWPVKCQSVPKWMQLPGTPEIEEKFHKMMKQGGFHETSIGDALSALQHKKKDWDEKIQQYFDLNKLAIASKLPDQPRIIAMVKHIRDFLKTIQDYVRNIALLLEALQADVNTLLAVEARMQAMIAQNLIALTNLMNQICNWNLPQIPSIAAQTNLLFHWSGFHLTALQGFNFNPNLTFDFNFSFAHCSLLPPNLPRTLQADINAYGFSIGGNSTKTMPFEGTLADLTQMSDPAYISSLLGNTTTPIIDPTTYLPSTTSLPDPKSILSNYHLPVATYRSNIISLVPALYPAILQPGLSDYSSIEPSQTAKNTLRQLLAKHVTLTQVVESRYDPNITAAWLFYLAQNRSARAGLWLPHFTTVYNDAIAPSLTYLANTPVPFNNVVDGTGVQSAPPSIPLIATLTSKAASDTLLWKLSYIEASLLGYVRTPTWDDGADAIFTATFTGTDIDYAVTSFPLTSTITLSLGVGTAEFPVSCTFPSAIAKTLAVAITYAEVSIAQAASYLSPRPQHRYTYNEFAEAKLVDRFSQFWRDFNYNLNTLMAGDAYVVGRTASYPEALDGAINPLSTNTAHYQAVVADSHARSRSWTAGSALLEIAKALAITESVAEPTNATNGWSSGTLDVKEFLARPDIQAQPLPTQIAMLRTSQSYNTLLGLQATLSNTVADAVSQANTVLTSAQIKGWSVANSVAASIASSELCSFDQVNSDSAQFATDSTHITATVAGHYVIAIELLWDPTGAPATRTVTLTQNGLGVEAASALASDADPFTTSMSAFVSLAVGDVLSVTAAHTASKAQNLLPGCSYIGLMGPNG